MKQLGAVVYASRYFIFINLYTSIIYVEILYKRYHKAIVQNTVRKDYARPYNSV